MTSRIAKDPNYGNSLANAFHYGLSAFARGQSEDDLKAKLAATEPKVSK